MIQHEKAHEVSKGDPRVNGPFLDDIRAAQEEEYRERRNQDGTFKRPENQRGFDPDDRNKDAVTDEEDLDESTDSTDPDASEEKTEAESEEEVHPSEGQVTDAD